MTMPLFVLYARALLFDIQEAQRNLEGWETLRADFLIELEYETQMFKLHIEYDPSNEVMGQIYAELLMCRKKLQSETEKTEDHTAHEETRKNGND